MLKRHIRSFLVLILLISVVLPLWVTPAEAAYANTHKNTGNMRNDIISVALTQVGYKEGSNNYTKYGAWYGLSNSPWCGMFVSWCAKEAGIPTSVLKRTGIANPRNFGLSYKNGSNYTPQKGDLFFKKSFSHVGLVYYVDGDYFYTIEGNTSDSGPQGDRVLIRRRKISDYYFSSPNYSGSGKTQTTAKCTHKYVIKAESAHPHKQYKICSKCNKKSYTGKTVDKNTCKTCIQANCNHKYSDWKKLNDDKHSRNCTKCGKTNIKKHNWENGKILIAATCVDKGTMQKICSDCGATEKKTIPATGKHKFDNFQYVDLKNHQKVCSVCNLKKTFPHNPSKKMNSDLIYHWTSCADCGSRLSQAEHTHPDGCLSACSTCGHTDSAGHTLTEELHYNEDSHWQVCIRCNQKDKIHNHVYTSPCDEVCDDCGYTRSNADNHNDVYHSDDTGHWQVCTTCARITEVISHTPDHNAKAWEDQVCVQCQYVLRSAESHEHSLISAYSDEITHWGQCSCGEEIKPEAHVWDIQSGCCSICAATYADNQEANIGLLSNIFQNLFGNA